MAAIIPPRSPFVTGGGQALAALAVGCAALAAGTCTTDPEDQELLQNIVVAVAEGIVESETFGDRFERTVTTPPVDLAVTEPADGTWVDCFASGRRMELTFRGTVRRAREVEVRPQGFGTVVVDLWAQVRAEGPERPDDLLQGELVTWSAEVWLAAGQNRVEVQAFGRPRATRHSQVLELTVGCLAGPCGDDADCPDDSHARCIGGTCMECREDADCHAIRPPFRRDDGYCVGGTCVECLVSDDCRQALDQDPSPRERHRCWENECVQCIEDAHCPDSRPFCTSGHACADGCRLASDCVREDGSPRLLSTRHGDGAHDCAWETCDYSETRHIHDDVGVGKCVADCSEYRAGWCAEHRRQEGQPMPRPWEWGCDQDYDMCLPGECDWPIQQCARPDERGECPCDEDSDCPQGECEQRDWRGDCVCGDDAQCGPGSRCVTGFCRAARCVDGVCQRSCDDEADCAVAIGYAVSLPAGDGDLVGRCVGQVHEGGGVCVFGCPNVGEECVDHHCRTNRCEVGCFGEQHCSYIGGACTPNWERACRPRPTDCPWEEEGCRPLNCSCWQCRDDSECPAGGVYSCSPDGACLSCPSPYPEGEECPLDRCPRVDRPPNRCGQCESHADCGRAGLDEGQEWGVCSVRRRGLPSGQVQQEGRCIRGKPHCSGVSDPEMPLEPHGWCAELWREQLWEGATPLDGLASAAFRCGVPEEQRRWGCLPTPLLEEDVLALFRMCCGYVHPNTGQRGHTVRVLGPCRTAHWECRDGAGEAGLAILHPELAEGSPGNRGHWDTLEEEGNRRPAGNVLSDRVCDAITLGLRQSADFPCADWLPLLDGLQE